MTLRLVLPNVDEKHQLELGCNTILIAQDRKAVVIDPGGASNLRSVNEFIQQHNLQVHFIVVTHAHIDHCLHLRELYESTGARILMHPNDRTLYRSLPLQAALLGRFRFKAPKVTDYIVDNDQITFGAMKLSVIHTPGHTKGSCCFLDANDPNTSWLYSGDTLFKGSIGRTNLPGGSFEAIYRSIRERLYSLSDNTMVIPGHGPVTTIKDEKTTNPFVKVLQCS